MESAGITRLSITPKMTTSFQAAHLYSLMSETEQRRLVANIAAHLSQVNKEDIIERSVSHFRNANRHYGDRVHRAVMEQRVARKYATRISI